MKEKILILGSSGFIGQALLEYFSTWKEYEAVGTYLNHKPASGEKSVLKSLDVTIPGQLTTLLKKVLPTTIINTIAIGNVEECEREKVLCSKINIEPTKEIVQYCKDNPKVKYIFFSSDHVFNGEAQEPYQENDEKNPLNYYGQTKLQCEQLITSTISNFAIIRSCFVFGLPKLHHHSNLFSTVHHTLRQNSVFNAYTDKIRSPCYVKDLPLIIEEIIRKHKNGILHAGGMPITVYEFSQAIAKYFHFNEKLVVGLPSNQKDFPPRPRNCALNNSRTKKELGINFRNLQEAFTDIKEASRREGLSC